MSLIRQLVKSIKDANITVLEDELYSAKVESYIDTGSYIFNAVLSGSLFLGLPGNKITAFAGEPATFKTSLALGIASNFQQIYENGIVALADTESAITEQHFKNFCIDKSRTMLLEPATVEEYRIMTTKLLDAYEKMENRPPMLMILDSLGNLSTEKEMKGAGEVDAPKDMTRSAAVKGLFRVLTLRLAKLKVPLICTNHTYALMNSYVPTQQMSGGSGLKYLASQIVQLSKKVDKDIKTKKVKGIFVKAAMKKSRLSIEENFVELYISYQKGVNKYYGLIDLGEQAGIFKRTGGWIEWYGGEKVREKDVYSEPLKYFTPEVLIKLDDYANTIFCYGQDNGDIEIDDETPEEV